MSNSAGVGHVVGAAPYIGDHLDTQSYYVRRYMRVLVGCSQDGCLGRGGSSVIMGSILTRSIRVY